MSKTIDVGRHKGNEESVNLAKESGKGIIRASALSTYGRCKWSYFLQYLHNAEEALKRAGTKSFKFTSNKAKRYPIALLDDNKEVAPFYAYRYENSAVATLGTSVHKAMEIGIKAKIAGEEAPLDLLIEEAQKEWKQLLEDAKDESGAIRLKLSESKDENLEDLENEIPELVTSYAEEILPFIENPTATEEVYRIEVNNPLFHSIQGSIDVEEKEAVRDLKVTSKKTQINRHIAQLSVYAWIREQNSKTTNKVFIDNLSRGARGVKAHILEAEPKVKYIDDILDDMLRTSEMWYKLGCIGAGTQLQEFLQDPKKYKDELSLLKILFSGSNPSDNFLCNKEWCGAWDNCPFVHNWQPKIKEIDGEDIFI